MMIVFTFGWYALLLSAWVGEMTVGYGVFGVIAAALIAWRWHAHVWRLDSVANRG